MPPVPETAPVPLPVPAPNVAPQPVPAPPASVVPRPYGSQPGLYDANRATDSRVIQSLPLTEAERYEFEIQHRQAWSFYQGRRYHDAIIKFADMSAKYPMNYLSSYWAGMCALRLNDREAAAEWFSLSLQMNPAYQPARDELTRMGR
jgi:TolA-binding protein